MNEKNYYTAPHQKVVKMAKRRPWGHKEPHLKEQDTFGRFHKDAAKNARKNLTSEAFVLWLAINSWTDEGEFALSNKMMREEWSFTDRTYRLCVHQLIDKKYLVPVNERSNIYIFYEDGFENNSSKFSTKPDTADAAKCEGEMKYIDKMWEMIRDFAYEVCGYGIHKNTERLIYSIFAEEYNIPQNDVELLFKKHLFDDESVRAAYTLFWQANKEEQNMYRNILFSVMDAKLVNIRKNFERIRSEKIKAITTTNEDEYIKNRNGK